MGELVHLISKRLHCIRPDTIQRGEHKYTKIKKHTNMNIQIQLVHRKHRKKTIERGEVILVKGSRNDLAFRYQAAASGMSPRKLGD